MIWRSALPPIVLVLVLAGCAEDGGTTSTPSQDAGDGAATTCHQAFAQIDAQDAAEAIEEAGDALDATIEACDSAEEWVEEASEALGITEEEGLAHLEGRCRSNPELTIVNACSDVAPSPS